MAERMKSYRTNWTNILLLCGKCARKMDGGYGEDGGDTLRSVMKTALKEAGLKRQTRLIETKCMGLCPKNAVIAVNASHPGRMLVIPKGTEANVVLARLGQPVFLG